MTAAGRASENKNVVESLFLSLLEDGKASRFERDSFV
jgi:hypothetical protein